MDVTAEIQSIRQQLDALEAKAQASPIMQALKTAALPADVETMIAGIIQGLQPYVSPPPASVPEVAA